MKVPKFSFRSGNIKTSVQCKIVVYCRHILLFKLYAGHKHCV